MTEECEEQARNKKILGKFSEQHTVQKVIGTMPFWDRFKLIISIVPVRSGKNMKMEPFDFLIGEARRRCFGDSLGWELIWSDFQDEIRFYLFLTCSRLACLRLKQAR